MQANYNTLLEGSSPLPCIDCRTDLRFAANDPRLAFSSYCFSSYLGVKQKEAGIHGIQWSMECTPKSVDPFAGQTHREGEGETRVYRHVMAAPPSCLELC